jgi:hypothetical protein
MPNFLLQGAYGGIVGRGIYVTSLKVIGWIPDEVIEFLQFI